jgi:c(7)-type cytochrome triheme protein
MNATCNRCHSLGKNVTRKYDFREFVKGWPRERLGNGVDWEKAEDRELIIPYDYIEGVSIKREKLIVQQDFKIAPTVEGMPDIIFSHDKHTFWNGCELCHPEIFTGIKKGLTKYSMVDLYEGKYCGVCHIKDAIPRRFNKCYEKFQSIYPPEFTVPVSFLWELYCRQLQQCLCAG